MNTKQKSIENKAKKVKKAKIDANNSDKKVNSFADAAEKFTFKNTSDKSYREFRNKVDDDAIKLANANRNFYELTFKNKGGLVMPIIIQWTYADGSKEKEYIPAEIWKLNENEVTKVFVKDKEVVNILIDPDLETADTNTSDNMFPRVEVKSKFDSYNKK